MWPRNKRRDSGGRINEMGQHGVHIGGSVVQLGMGALGAYRPVRLSLQPARTFPLSSLKEVSRESDLQSVLLRGR